MSLKSDPLEILFSVYSLWAVDGADKIFPSAAREGNIAPVILEYRRGDSFDCCPEEVCKSFITQH